MKSLNLLCITILTCIIHGCVSIHQGLIQPSQVLLHNSNFKTIKTITGEASATYVFGIGGYNKEGLINEAKKDMYQKYQLSENQAIANITLDSKHTFIFYPLLYTKKIIISADVIQFGTDIKAVNEIINQNYNDIKKDLSSNKGGMNIIISEDEQTINKLSITKDLKESTYMNMEDVKVGDFVKFASIYHDIIYGKIIDKSSNRIVMIKHFPSPGTVVTEEVNFKALTKVEF